jgi:uncharacterized membrane protein YcaP (DUF421 family)
MNKVTITEAARLAGISRQHLYRGFINTGKISVIKDNDKSVIEISELLRVFPDAKTVTTDSDTTPHHETIRNDNVTSDNSELVTMLKTQLAEAKEREEWLKQQIDELRHQQNNLLEDKTLKQPRKKLFGIF